MKEYDPHNPFERLAWHKKMSREIVLGTVFLLITSDLLALLYFLRSPHYLYVWELLLGGVWALWLGYCIWERWRALKRHREIIDLDIKSEQRDQDL